MGTKEHEQSPLNKILQPLRRRFGAEQTSSSHNGEAVTEIDYKDASFDWIGGVAKVFKEVIEVQRPSNESDGGLEIAAYLIPRTESDLAVSDRKYSTLTITRDLLSREPHFKVDLRTDDNDDGCQPYHSLISSLMVNENAQWICFSPPDTRGKTLHGIVESTSLKVFASGKVERPK